MNFQSQDPNVNQTVVSLDEWCAKRRPEREPLQVEEGLLQLMRTRSPKGSWALVTEMLGY